MLAFLVVVPINTLPTHITIPFSFLHTFEESIQGLIEKLGSVMNIAPYEEFVPYNICIYIGLSFIPFELFNYLCTNHFVSNRTMLNECSSLTRKYLFNVHGRLIVIDDAVRY